MHIRHPTPSDAGRIAEIHVLGWQTAYRDLMPASVLDGLSVENRQRMWDRRLAADTTNALVAEVDGVVVGWVIFGPCRDSDTTAAVEVYGIYLDPGFTRRGIGRALWQSACRLLAQCYDQCAVWVLTANMPSRHFYEAMGARLDPTAEKWFEQDGARLPEVRYWCRLRPPLPLNPCIPVRSRYTAWLDFLESDDHGH